MLEPIKHYAQNRTCLRLKWVNQLVSCSMVNCSFTVLCSVFSLYPSMHDPKKQRQKKAYVSHKTETWLEVKNKGALEHSLAKVFLQKKHYIRRNILVTLPWKSDTRIRCLIRLKRYQFRLQAIRCLRKPSAKMPACIITELHVLMPGAFKTP